MKKIFLIICLFFSTNCSNVDIRLSPKTRGVDPIFKPYIDGYKLLINPGYHPRFEKLSINLVDMNPSVLGRCYWFVSGETEIEINKIWWESYFTTEIDRQFTVFHELEHCIRYRMHSNKRQKIENIEQFFQEILYYIGKRPKRGYFDDGCPSSIMHYSAFDESCQINHYDEYIREIINWEPKRKN